MSSTDQARADGLATPEHIAGRYALIQRLARGGTGEVWLARELATGREVTLKRLLQRSRHHEALLRCEYDTLAHLRSPFLIQVFELGEDRGLPFYTMERLDGRDLRDSTHLSVDDGRRILLDVARGLLELHVQRWLHRDISPRGVQRTGNGRCKLTEFGTIAPFGVAPNVAGTPGFIAPEAREGALLDQRADIYSLGALAYWLFTRRIPDPSRPGNPSSRGTEGPAPLRQLRPDVPPELDQLVMSMLAFDPQSRPVSAAKIIAHLSPELEADLAFAADSQLASCALVGRTASLSHAERALRRAAVGSGGGLLVHGTAGIGKTRFLQELSLVGQRAGFSVVRAFATRSAGGARVARDLYLRLRRAAPSAFRQLPERERATLADFDADHASHTAANPGEARARLQWALSRYFREVTASAPWLILVDDIDQADEFSEAFVAALATMAETLPLLVVATCSETGDSGETAMEAMRARGQCVQLEELERVDLGRLVSNLFGEVPGRTFLADFLYREARGNPGITLELCSWLIERGSIRHRKGAFILPGSEVISRLPTGAVSSLMRRMENLPGEARELAELVALCRGGASLELCLAASPAPAETVLAALRDLVSRGIFVGLGPVYAFRQDALRNQVGRSLPPDRARALHGRLAHAYLEVDRPNAVRQVEAAFHLLHTDQELEGAELLRRVGPALIDSGIAYQEAISGLERALAVFERRGHSQCAVIDVRTALARASYLYDYRLADRYAERTLDLLRDWCGLHAWKRFQRYLPRRLTLLFCLLVMVWRRFWGRPSNIGPSPVTSLEYLVRALMATLAVRVTGLDGAGARRLLADFEQLRSGAKSGPMAALHLAAHALSLHPFGREAEQRVALDQALEAVAQPWPASMQGSPRQDLLVGLLLSRGMNECYRSGSHALDIAQTLEGEGTRLARAAAHRVRFSYYTVRGVRDKAEEYRRELNICGIQGGTTWQMEWFAVPIEGMASALLGDLPGTGRALDQLESLAETMPSMVPLRDMVKIGYHVLRDEHETAVRLGSEFVAQYRPHSVVGWGAAYAAYAAALNRIGQSQLAARVCERALAALAEEDHEYIVMYGPLMRELGVAWTNTGRFERALTYADQNVAVLEAAGEDALLVHAHEHRAAMAQRVSNHALLAHALITMRDTAERSGSSSLIEQAAKAAHTNLRSTSELSVVDYDSQAGPDSEDGLDSDEPLTSPGGYRRRQQ